MVSVFFQLQLLSKAPVTKTEVAPKQKLQSNYQQNEGML
jgi:hypothetical protein